MLKTNFTLRERYGNRRLGEFLKELELIEGRAMGIPTILKSLKENGSPAPRFKSCSLLQSFLTQNHSLHNSK
ncbi:MAG: ATP-binding protein [Sphaerochaetaceae bacterium]|jgi:ATP-dependent DNA helicase RecG